MGISEGHIKNVSVAEMQSESMKVWVLFSLVIFTIQAIFVFLYLKMTPFPDSFLGFVGYVFTVIASVVSIFFLDKIGNKYDWYIFSRMEYFKSWKCKNDNIIKATEGWQMITIFFFAVVWVGVLFYAPKNTHDAVFEPSVLSWLDEGNCEEIKKYEEKTATFCSETMGEARKNTAGIFVVKDKSLSANAVGCIYLLESEDAINISTTKPQSCDFIKGQKVAVTLHSFLDTRVSGGADVYGYSLLIK